MDMHEASRILNMDLLGLTPCDFDLSDATMEPDPGPPPEAVFDRVTGPYDRRSAIAGPGAFGTGRGGALGGTGTRAPLSESARRVPFRDGDGYPPAKEETRWTPRSCSRWKARSRS